MVAVVMVGVLMGRCGGDSGDGDNGVGVVVVV